MLVGMEFYFQAVLAAHPVGEPLQHLRHVAMGKDGRAQVHGQVARGFQGLVQETVDLVNHWPELGRFAPAAQHPQMELRALADTLG